MRGMGDTTAYLRRGIREIICLALFFFTFLACEYLFDVRMAEFVPSSEVVIYESIVVGASVIGFFVHPFLYYRLPQTIDATSDITGVLLVSALLLMITAVRFEVVIAGGLVACCALGYCGSTAHANLARRFAQTPCLARAAALSYAMGVLVQVINHMVMPVGIPQQAVLVVCAIAQVALLHGARRAKLRDESDPSFEPSVARAFGRCFGIWRQVARRSRGKGGIPSCRSSPDRGDGVSFRRIRRSQRGLHDLACCRSRRFGRLAAPAACRELVGRWRTI